MRSAEAYIAFGSNVGDRVGNLRLALAELEKVCRVTACSPLYSTEPVGYLDQGWFLNGVVRVETELAPVQMLARLHSIEQGLGRDRSMQNIRNGPRTIDLDILHWGGLHLNEPGLTIPHPRAHERLFVVAPWTDLAPNLVLPAAGKTLAQLRHELEGTSSVTFHCAAPW